MVLEFNENIHSDCLKALQIGFNSRAAVAFLGNYSVLVMLDELQYGNFEEDRKQAICIMNYDKSKLIFFGSVFSIFVSL